MQWTDRLLRSVRQRGGDGFCEGLGVQRGERVLHARQDPEPRVRFRAFGPSSLDFQLLVWVKDPEDRGKAMDTVLEAVLTRLRAEGVEIPYPKQDLYLKEQPSS